MTTRASTIPLVRLLRCFPLIAVGLAVTSAAVANTTGTVSAPSTPPSNAYIEHPQPAVTVTSTYSGGTYYNSGPSYNYYNGFVPGYYHDAVTYFPRRYFFPPNPPALGEPYPRNRTKSAGLTRSSIPLALSEYVNEPFYSPLSPFLYEEDLSRRRQKMVDDYMNEKRALTEELRAKIKTAESLDPAAREAALEQFAREQTPRVVAAESTAYAIRDDLTRWRLFADTADWNEGREWRLGDDTRWESTLDEAKAMRGAAYYQDGLSPAQRRLLREYAMELEDSGAGPVSDVRLDAHGPFFYFSPETSRIRLPANLPPELAEKIATYTRQKMELKKELRDVLYREDRRWFDYRRTSALRELAAKQADRIAALEPLAEEIRQGLAKLPNPARPAVAAQVLPADMAGRITKFMDERAAYETTMNGRYRALRLQFPTSRVEFVKINGAFGIQLVPNRTLRPDVRAQAEAAIAQLDPFNDTEAKAYMALIQEKNGIRSDLVKSAGAIAPLVTPRIVDLILRDYANTLAEQELWKQYHDYEVAVLEPGLSPEQRRMLYDAALVKLDQQLPFYTY